MTNTEIVLECQQLTKTYTDGALEVNVLKGINFSLKRGEKVVVLGPSGAGKSTWLHLLGGLDKPTTGTVRLVDHDLREISEEKRSELRNRHLGFVYQFHHLLPEFSALENVAMPLFIRGLAIADAEEQAAELLSKVGLAQRLHHRLGQLSGGERQRTAIARALVTNPVCLLADEPTGNLDHHTAEKVYETMFALNQELQTSLLIVTHDVRLSARMDRVFRLEDGVLTEVSEKSALNDALIARPLKA